MRDLGRIQADGGGGEPREVLAQGCKEMERKIDNYYPFYILYIYISKLKLRLPTFFQTIALKLRIHQKKILEYV